MSALDDAVQAVRLSDARTRRRQHFTAAADRGVLALRRAAGPWTWTAWLLRGGSLLGGRLVASAKLEEAQGEHVAVLRLVFMSEPATAVGLDELLPAALERPGVEAALEARIRHRWATAVNQALAGEPNWLELITPGGSRRWERRSSAAPETDNYRSRALAPGEDSQAVVVRVALPEPSLTDRMRRWAGADTLASAIATVWSDRLRRVVTPEEVHEGVLVAEEPEGPSVRLGSIGEWWPGFEGSSLCLFREGVVLCGFSEALASVGGPPEGLRGAVVCPALRLDADEHSVVVDRELHQLVAWLASASTLAADAPTPDDVGTWRWPEPEPVLDGRGDDMFDRLVEREGEVTFAWPHQVAELRALGIHALGLTPRAAQRLLDAGVSLFPAEVLLRDGAGREQDLTALRQGALGPVTLGPAAMGPVAHGRASLEAYVHRHAVATQGFIRIRAWKREIFQKPCSLEGVTVVVTLDVRALPSEAELEEMHAAADAAVVEQRDALLAYVDAELDSDTQRRTVPLVAAWLHAVSGMDMGLAYAPAGDGVTLRWNAAGYRAFRIGRERDGTPRTLEDALHRYRDAGGIVAGEPTRRWETLESKVPVWTTWMLNDFGREVLARLLGPTALWTMPTVPEAQLRPVPLRTQTQQLASAARVAEQRAKLSQRSDAACVLRGHLLVARALGKDALGLETTPLFSYFDPEALQPRRWISLSELEALGPVRVVPPTVADRTLSAGVLEAEPGLAYALAELQLVSAGDVARTRTPARAGARSASRPRPTTVQDWLRHPVTHPLFAGGLKLSSDGGGVEVWARGLRVGRFELPPPWQEVGGKLWLSREAPARGHTAIEAGVLRSMGALREAARDAARLCPPGSARRKALTDFVARTESRQSPPAAVVPVASRLGSDRLAALLRFALGRVVAVETSSLSWKIVRVAGAGDRQSLKLGGRHALIRAARAESASPADLVVAALLVVAVLDSVPAEVGGPPFDLSTALTRILAVLDS